MPESYSGLIAAAAAAAGYSGSPLSVELAVQDIDLAQAEPLSGEQ